MARQLVVFVMDRIFRHFGSKRGRITTHFMTQKLSNAVSIMMILIKPTLFHHQKIFLIDIQVRFLCAKVTDSKELLFAELL